MRLRQLWRSLKNLATMKAIHILTTLLALMLAPGITAAQTAVGEAEYALSSDVEAAWGTGKAETYDVAMRITAKSLVGTSVTGIKVPIRNAAALSELKVWMTKQLALDGKDNKADIATKDAETTEGWCEVRFDQPYTITEEGVFVGYTVTADATEKNPVGVCTGFNDGALWVHTSRTFRKWTDKSEELGVSLAMKVIISGTHENAAAADGMKQVNVQAGNPVETEFKLVNHGQKAITEFDYTWTLAGNSGADHVELAEPVEARLGATKTVKLSMPAVAEQGAYTLKVKINKVNGVDNTDTQAENAATVNVYKILPKHRALYEEYTGLWCGWCVRGFVALEKMNELHGDDFVGISYHSGDDMQVIKNTAFPSPVDGFPSAWLDRTADIDPYYGTSVSEKPLGVEADWAASCATISPADVSATATLNTAAGKVRVDAGVMFPTGYSGGNYKLSYVLVADSMKSDMWVQSNYYNGKTTGDPNLEPFETAGSNLLGLVFNDVVVATSDIHGIDGSMPESAAAEELMEHSYEFDLASIKNLAGMPLPINNNLEAAVILLDGTTGRVVNCIKVKVVDDPTGITVHKADADSTQNAAYDLSGRRIAKPGKGVTVVRRADGTVYKTVAR